MMRALRLAGILLPTILASTVQGQIGYLWTFDELKARADLVLIAECANITDTGHEAMHPGLTPGFPVVEMRGQFRVATILKASKSTPAVGSSVTLFYYRPDPARWLRDQPQKPGQPPPGMANAGSTLELEVNANYLLFLTSGPAGTYQPLSGHTFPHESVYLLWNQGRRCPTNGCS